MSYFYFFNKHKGNFVDIINIIMFFCVMFYYIVKTRNVYPYFL
jgi:hypothetical protein